MRFILRPAFALAVFFAVLTGSLVIHPPAYAQAVTQNIRILTSAGQPIVGATVTFYVHGAAQVVGNVVATGVTDVNGYVKNAGSPISLVPATQYDFTTTSSSLPYGTFTAGTAVQLIPGPSGPPGPTGPPGTGTPATACASVSGNPCAQLATASPQPAGDAVFDSSGHLLSSPKPVPSCVNTNCSFSGYALTSVTPTPFPSPVPTALPSSCAGYSALFAPQYSPCQLTTAVTPAWVVPSFALADTQNFTSGAADAGGAATQPTFVVWNSNQSVFDAIWILYMGTAHNYQVKVTKLDPSTGTTTSATSTTQTTLAPVGLKPAVDSSGNIFIPFADSGNTSHVIMLKISTALAFTFGASVSTGNVVLTAGNCNGGANSNPGVNFTNQPYTDGTFVYYACIGSSSFGIGEKYTIGSNSAADVGNSGSASTYLCYYWPAQSDFYCFLSTPNIFKIVGAGNVTVTGDSNSAATMQAQWVTDNGGTSLFWYSAGNIRKLTSAGALSHVAVAISAPATSHLIGYNSSDSKVYFSNCSSLTVVSLTAQACDVESWDGVAASTTVVAPYGHLLNDIASTSPSSGQTRAFGLKAGSGPTIAFTVNQNGNPATTAAGYIGYLQLGQTPSAITLTKQLRFGVVPLISSAVPVNAPYTVLVTFPNSFAFTSATSYRCKAMSPSGTESPLAVQVFPYSTTQAVLYYGNGFLNTMGAEILVDCGGN